MPVFTSRIETRHTLVGVSRDGRRLLAALGRREAELSIALCDDVFIRAQNLQWRGKDAATDVLSFGQNDPRILGDVLISVERAAEQAAELGHDLPTELRILLVHGLCHLLGHDHEDAESAGRMRAQERLLLTTLGVATASLIARAEGDEGPPER